MSYNAEYISITLKKELYLYKSKILNEAPIIYPI